MSDETRDLLALQAALNALRADGRGLVKVGMEYEVARIVRDALAEQPAQGEALNRCQPKPYAGGSIAPGGVVTAAQSKPEEMRAAAPEVPHGCTCNASGPCYKHR